MTRHLTVFLIFEKNQKLKYHLIPTERAFFQKIETFGLGQTNWAEILGDICGISCQNISTILAL